jgi:hypothetical protein
MHAHMHMFPRMQLQSQRRIQPARTRFVGPLEYWVTSTSPLAPGHSIPAMQSAQVDPRLDRTHAHLAIVCTHARTHTHTHTDTLHTRSNGHTCTACRVLLLSACASGYPQYADTCFVTTSFSGMDIRTGEAIVDETNCYVRSHHITNTDTPPCPSTRLCTVDFFAHTDRHA